MTTTLFPELHTQEMWSLFSDQVPFTLEVRSIWPKGIAAAGPTLSRCFDTSQYKTLTALKKAVEQYVSQMNQRGYNMYATLNPLKSGIGTNQAASDDDVECRRRLLIDIDRDHDKEHPAEQQEIEAARSLGDQIEKHFDAQGWPTPVRIMSGNGHHLVYPLNDLPNNKEVTNAIRELLHNLKLKFSGSGLSVDTAVSNASRVTKLPGTLARRGTETETRIYRVARIYE